MNNNAKNFSRYYFITSFAVIFFITVSIGSYFVFGKHTEFKRFALNDKITNIENKKQLLKNIVDSYLNQAKYVISNSETTLSNIIYNRVNTAINISHNIYDHMSDRAEAEKTIKAALSSMIFGNEYIFAFDMNGVIKLSPLLPQIEGKSMIDKQDSAGSYTMRESLAIIKNHGEGYLNVYWTDPEDKEAGLKRKLVYIKFFEPLGWAIGYGAYLDNHENRVKQEVLQLLETVSYDNDGYLFAADYTGVSLIKPAKGRNMFDVQDVNGKYIVREMIKTAKNGGGFVTYVMPPFKGARPENKISYVTSIPEWGWYVGTGMYLTDIESEYENRIGVIFQAEKRELALVVVGLVFVLFGGAYVVYIFSQRLQRLIDSHNEVISLKNEELSELNRSLEKRVQEKTAELNELNRSLEQRVEEEVEKNREKDRIMFQQGRLAAMGEMIGNIAHQWRQPLSSISLLVQDIQEAHEMGELDGAYLNDTVSKCTVTISHMSDTIDNFRDFFRPQEQASSFRPEDEIKKCISLLDAGLNNNQIEVRLDLQSDKSVNGVSGEFTQVVINIVSNAKDVLLSRNIQNPYIKISSYDTDDKVIVEIEDNGGGIDPEIIDKIFEPYFTTKDQSSGTGIGLYFSKMIVDGHLGGTLLAENSEIGALFRISIPV